MEKQRLTIVKVGGAVVEDEALGLARLGRKAKAAPNHLDEKPRAVRRPEERDCIEARNVGPGSQHRNVAAVLERPRRSPEEVGRDALAAKAAYRLGALEVGRVARDDGALLAGQLRDLGRDLLAVRDRRAEAQPYKGLSQTKVKSRMYASKFPTERRTASCAR